jgi:hypothetical protein
MTPPPCRRFFKRIKALHGCHTVNEHTFRIPLNGATSTSVRGPAAPADHARVCRLHGPDNRLDSRGHQPRCDGARPPGEARGRVAQAERPLHLPDSSGRLQNVPGGGPVDPPAAVCLALHPARQGRSRHRPTALQIRLEIARVDAPSRYPDRQQLPSMDFGAHVVLTATQTMGHVGDLEQPRRDGGRLDRRTARGRRSLCQVAVDHITTRGRGDRFLSGASVSGPAPALTRSSAISKIFGNHSRLNSEFKAGAFCSAFRGTSGAAAVFFDSCLIVFG